MIEPDPNATFEVVLSQHQGLPEGQRPVFVFRMLRRVHAKRLAKLLAEAQTVPDDADAGWAMDFFDRVEQAIRGLLAGWRHQTGVDGQPLDYDPSRLDEVVDDSDLGELMAVLRNQSTLTATDKKKSAWQWPSKPGPSAQSVNPPPDTPDTPDQGAVSTDPASPAPPS